MFGDEPKPVKAEGSSLFDDKGKECGSNSLTSKRRVDDESGKPRSLELDFVPRFDFAIADEHCNPEWSS